MSDEGNFQPYLLCSREAKGAAGWTNYQWPMIYSTGSEASKIPKRWGSGGFRVDEHVEVLGGDGSSVPPFPPGCSWSYVSPCKQINRTQGRSRGKPRTHSHSEAQVTTWAWAWPLKRSGAGRQSGGTELRTCGIWRFHQVDSIRIELHCRTLSWCPRIGWCGGNPHTSGDQKCQKSCCV